MTSRCSDTWCTRSTPGRGKAEYVLAEDAWGHGYATETLQAIVELATSLSVRQLRALCHPEHTTSQRVLEKCGFRSVGILTISGAFPNLSGDAVAPVLNYSRSCADHCA